MTSNDIKQSIIEKLECEFVEILGEDGAHFEGTIVSSLFEGLNRVKQHQLVFNALGDKMKSDIHALSMKTYTPNEWDQLKT
ncbi:BolA/IbaG family iron-sulfur metabolism protein [Candidatus Methylopumilus universalis]|jgi:acid stress-induced BolA-like protein IbaG/YrbA|uniref:BolA/IbaG family iron-sulfur metabolism protein n=1 Tax=Candidatus Methylopumilus universalis TaxID=2588536 RepID=A0AAX1EYB2_9PROT|nr:BolA/IbaG family iron-sulfur metabolism protein [Candidatus Methylopumilus universalis]MBW0156113.1 BolA/IbaG family iron-sulfur metabolism protein [Candidatus Methylopumilus sp.]MCF8183091.1 BolA/IbaG family iron-sulfur metabolism protein [Limnohabitans sp.]MCF8161676.1 BolA/IbaG family iron-sulfur metabolism protein [Candidatus Methylopumilus sp.]QDC40636.1 BolA/IbaG family iron-sulfur metabolism protein [Candidatus Methylopumilus universalis]QDC41925.1 BolA/IbaG family iron-sulfur metabo